MEVEPRIAVITVHGVADQNPFETARALATSMQALRNLPTTDTTPDGYRPAAYDPFVESRLQVPVTPFPVDAALSPEAAGARSDSPVARGLRSIRNSLYSDFGAKLLNRERGREGRYSDYGFMQNQLTGYTGRDDPATFDTVALRTTRTSGRERTAVDVYELYWADLSRLGKGVFRLLGELYQLLFHISSLGKSAVDLAHQVDGRPILHVLRATQAISSWLLVLPIAILNLYLVLLALGLFVAKIPDPWKDAVAWGIGSALVGGLIAMFFVYRRWQLDFPRWSLEQLLGFIAGALGAYGFTRVLTKGADEFFAAVWVLLIAIGADMFARYYEQRRPGAIAISRLTAIFCLCTMLFFIRAADTNEAPVVLLLGRVSEFLFIVLSLTWLALVLAHLMTGCVGEYAIRTTPRSETGQGLRDRYSEIYRAVWTGRFALVVPTAAFLLITLGLWFGAASSFEKQLAQFHYKPFFAFFNVEGPDVSKLVMYLLDHAAGPMFNSFFVLLSIAFALVLWGLGPAIIAEVLPPRETQRDTALRVGHWLDHGFRLAGLAGWLAVIATLVVLPLGYGIHSGLSYFELPTAPPSLIVTLVSLLGGSAVGLVVLGRDFSGGFRSVVDILLDVDNWLKERPPGKNPSARISARLFSLLDHVTRRKDESGRTYDALVIVAHSQGTVIIADVLRTLRESSRPEARALLERMPIYLLTVGCPLRQLYGRRFPHLYSWAVHADETAGASQEGWRIGNIPKHQAPDPQLIGVELWVNAFKSGDYVGRHLWLLDDDPSRWQPAEPNGLWVATDSQHSAAADVTRVELCIGAGAHTHYFDATSTRAAQLLDQMIGIAASGKQRYPIPFPRFSPGS